jgi:hypothetical protein
MPSCEAASRKALRIPRITGVDLDASRREVLHSEEDFGMQDIVQPGAAQIGHRHVVEVMLAPQRLAARPIQIEKGSEIVERVGAAKFRRTRPRQLDIVSSRQFEHHLRFEAAFQMHVEFGLWQIVNEGIEFVHVRSSILVRA